MTEADLVDEKIHKSNKHVVLQTDDTSKNVTIADDTVIVERKTQPKWTVPTQTWDTVYRAGDDGAKPVTQSEQLHPCLGDESLPMEISTFKFTSMDDGLRRTATLAES